MSRSFRHDNAVPVALFAYARPAHLQRTLESLKANAVPVIYAFSDGPKTPDKEPEVRQVREILRKLSWARVVLRESEKNLGLGGSLLSGITQVLQEHDTVIIMEDDLICVPGAIAYLSGALKRYQDDARVMSVTGWTHPRVTPSDVIDQPYFDGRAECWGWGTWARAWEGMDTDAMSLLHACEERGIDIGRYGVDLPEQARLELERNLWAVRLSYLHMLNGGLCLRPPHSMVEHIGFGAGATNAGSAAQWANPPLKVCPPLPQSWPEPTENPQCPHLWQAACPAAPMLARLLNLYRRICKRLLHSENRREGPEGGSQN